MNILEKLHEKYGKYIEEALRKYLIIDVSSDFKDAVLYQIETGGKRVRPLITLLCAEACNGDFKKALPAACIVELIHNYSLIYDDIIDRSDVRRGKPTVRKKFGDYAAILVGIWYREAIEEAILETSRPEIFSKEVCRVIKEIDEGERLDILLEVTGRVDPYFIDNRIVNKVSNIEELKLIYHRMISLKTAALFRTSAKLGALSVTDNEDYVRACEDYGKYVGMAFQVIDDLLDIYGEFEKFGKEIGKDIREHKLGNAVIIYALEELTDTDRERLFKILGKESIEKSDIEEAVKILDKTSSRGKCLELARNYIEKAMTCIEKLPSKHHVDELKKLAQFIITREY